MKKLLKSAILTLLALIVILSVFPTSVFANDTESTFEPRLSAPSRSNAYYNRKLNVYAQGGYGMPNCIAYVYGRVYEITGEAPKWSRGSADELWSKNKRNGYYEYGQEPRIGAIACWSNHVSVVEKIEGNKVTASQSHWHGNYFDTSTFTSGTNRYGQKFYGYIYACDEYFAEIEAEAEKERIAKLAYSTQQLELKAPETEKTKQFPIETLNGTYDKDILMNSVMLEPAMESMKKAS